MASTSHLSNSSRASAERSTGKICGAELISFMGDEMNRAFSLILCSLVCTALIVAQQRVPPPRTPSPAAPQTPDLFRNMTPEQRIRVRERLRALLDEHGAFERRAAPTPAQRPLPRLSWPSVVDQPVSPISTLSDLPAIKYGDWGVSGLKGFESNDWLWSKADSAKLEQTLAGIDLNVNLNVEDISRAFGALNQPDQRIAASKPSVPRPAGHTLPALPSISVAPSSPARAQASRLKLPKIIFVHTPCAYQCRHFYNNCNERKTGPKGGWKNPSACEHGLSACLQTCR